MRKPVLLLYRELQETEPYRAAIDAVGAEPVLVLAGDSFDLDKFAGILLTGGDDVNPSLYGQDRHPLTEPSDDVRDSEECRVIAEAIQRDMPLLAICRGQQILNVQHGGTLIQHLENASFHQTRPADKAQPAHDVSIVPGTLLAGVADATQWDVNSRHHQALDRIGEGLRVAARSKDGVIEAVERPGQRFMLAVQWHPENQMPVSRAQRKLFEAFVRVL